MSGTISTPTLDNQKLLADTLKSYPKDLGKALLANLIEGEEIEWTGKYKVLGAEAAREVNGKVRMATPLRTFKKTSIDTVKGFFKTANYSNMIGEDANSLVKAYAFMDNWYDVLKTTKTLLTLSAGPVSLVFSAISLFDTLSTAWKDANAWYDSLGEDEHKREGAHLAHLNQLNKKVIDNIYASIEQSWKLPTAIQRKQAAADFYAQLNKYLPVPKLTHAARTIRNTMIASQNQRVRDIDLRYQSQLQGMMGLLMQGEMLRNTLDLVVEDCDANPLRYWGCSFAKGYVNPGLGLVGEVINAGSSTVSLTLLKPKVKHYKVVGSFGPETKPHVEATLTNIKNNVRGKAIEMANLLDSKHLLALRERSIQLIQQLT